MSATVLLSSGVTNAAALVKTTWLPAASIDGLFADTSNVAPVRPLPLDTSWVVGGVTARLRTKTSSASPSSALRFAAADSNAIRVPSLDSAGRSDVASPGAPTEVVARETRVVV